MSRNFRLSFLPVRRFIFIIFYRMLLHRKFWEKFRLKFSFEIGRDISGENAEDRGNSNISNMPILFGKQIIFLIYLGSSLVIFDKKILNVVCETLDICYLIVIFDFGTNNRSCGRRKRYDFRKHMYRHTSACFYIVSH